MESLWTAYHNIPKLERQPILKLFIVHGEPSADFNKALKNFYTDDIAAKPQNFINHIEKLCM